MCVSLLPAFSVSASAIDVDGISVYTHWWKTETPTEYESFESIIETEENSNRITVQTDYYIPIAIEANQTFNFETQVVYSDSDSATIREVQFLNPNWGIIHKMSNVSHSDGYINITEIQLDQKVKYIRVIMDFVNPTWVDQYGNTYAVNMGTVNLYTTTGVKKKTYESVVYVTVNNDGKLIIQKSDNTETTVAATAIYGAAGKYIVGLSSTAENANSGLADIAILGEIVRIEEDTNLYVINSTELTAPDKPTPEPEPIVYMFEFSVNSAKIEEQDEQGLINGIIQWIKKIYTGITSIPQKITETAQNIIQTISELPQKLAEAIKNLFIPSEADITAIKTDFEDLLSDRFGAVYESSDILVDFATAFTDQGTQETITFPSTTVNLAGADFTFGGWEVDVVPDFLSGLIDVLKLIVNISCTFLFVNGMRKRLEGILE